MSLILKSTESDNCILTVALGHWYPKGQARLLQSLDVVKYRGRLIKWTEQWPNDNYNKDCPYNAKAAAFEEAMTSGNRNLLWVDCSVWAVKNPKPIFDIIKREGYYFLNNGYNCAQTCSDACLKYFDLTRDEAEKMKECATGVFGVSLDHEIGMHFITEFITACKLGAAVGSRLHDNQSKDERFLFHRQDQSVASIIANRLGMKFREWGQEVEYDPAHVKPQTVLTLRGM